MTEKPECADECHKDAETAIRASSCIDIIASVMLKIASYAYSCFMTNKVSGVIEFVGEDLFEW